MEGKVLDFYSMSGEGILLGADGKRYHFNEPDWKGQVKPRQGISVDFEIEGDRARAIYTVATGAAAGGKNKTTAGLLAIFLGGFGVHKFYLGFNGPALVYLLTNTVGFAVSWLLLFIPNMVLSAIAFIEGIIYLTQTDEDFERNYLIDKKQWF